MPSAAAAKIRFDWAVNVHPEFATPAELPDALLASYPDAAFFGVRGSAGTGTTPRRGWATELIAQRSDWWPALGIAIQHAAKDGGELAQIALATLLADYRDMFALLPWTAPLAEGMSFSVRAPLGDGMGHARLHDPAIVRDQQRSFAEIHGAKEQFLYQYGKNGTNLKGPFTKEADLRALLAKSAPAGQFPHGTRGRGAGSARRLSSATSGCARSWSTRSRRSTRTTRSWRSRFSIDSPRSAICGSSRRCSTAGRRPLRRGGKSQRRRSRQAGDTARSSHWPNVATMGDIAIEANRRARQQLATPPVLDLLALHGRTFPDLALVGGCRSDVERRSEHARGG